MTALTSDLSRAVARLRAGGVVAFPTETVYGLGADASNGSAVQRVFEIKSRPSTNPLIVHVADEAVARRYAAVWPPAAEILARAFWPGPITLVVTRASSIAVEVAAGGQTIGLRAPDHPLAMQLLRAFDGPVAAPSANRSSRISPTTADHVRKDLGSLVDLILDGGPCRVGIESTVIDLAAAAPTILRPGAVTREQIEAHIGSVRVLDEHTKSGVPARSPGQHAVHYAPRASAFRFDASQAALLARWRRKHALDSAYVMLLDKSSSPAIASTESPRHTIRWMPDSPAEYARLLYSVLRAADDLSPAAIWIEMPPNTSPWTAVRDRLRRATLDPGLAD